MTDEPIDHYQRAVTALDAAEGNMRSPGIDPQMKTPQAQYLAAYALTHAVLALVQETRSHG